MSEQIKQLLKETWAYIGTEEQTKVLKTLSKVDAETYLNGLSRLEVDTDFQKELGIFCY